MWTNLAKPMMLGPAGSSTMACFDVQTPVRQCVL